MFIRKMSLPQSVSQSVPTFTCIYIHNNVSIYTFINSVHCVQMICQIYGCVIKLYYMKEIGYNRSQGYVNDNIRLTFYSINFQTIFGSYVSLILTSVLPVPIVSHLSPLDTRTCAKIWFL